jgi:competence protein ComEC
VVASGLALAAVMLRRRAVPILAAAALVAGAVSGTLAAERTAATFAADLPDGVVTVVGRARSDPEPWGPDLARFMVVPSLLGEGESAVAWQGPPLMVVAEEPLALMAGDEVLVQGRLGADPGRVRGDPVAGTLRARTVTRVAAPSTPWFRAGNALRARIQAMVPGDRDAATALLAGFLVGDVTRLPDGDVEALRRAGLTHFVAVSGSNVALFLGAWWLVVAPLRLGPRLRASLGLGALVVFVVLTRWESSVVRAATMAGLVLAGRIAGVPVDAWTALGGAVTLLLLAAGDLATDVGFQLSVAATAGVLAGAGRLFAGRAPRWLWTILAATVSAQAAVMPLLLGTFGSVPLLAPLANLLAAPLVTAATSVGGIGVVVGWGGLVRLASWLAGLVLAVAHAAAGWPQLDLVGVVAVAGAAAALRIRTLRPLVVAVTAVVLVVAARPPPPPSEATVTFLDVGQGDAVLLRDPTGAAVLVDGGREPRVLREALGRYGIERLALVVATHGDVDHVGGLEGLTDAVTVERFWAPDHPDGGDLLATLVAEAAATGIPVDRVRDGVTATVGAFRLETLGPRRRYAADNDGSVVLWVEVAGRSVLLAGDAGAVAQGELPEVRPDVLLVPHHGSASSDPDWIERTVGEVAVVSVGANTYGHPAPEIMDLLDRLGVEVHLTMVEGDVSIPLSGGERRLQ